MMPRLASSPSPERAPQVTSALLEVVRALSAELHAGRAPASVSVDAGLDRDLGIDSLARMELLLRLRQRFGVTISEEEAMAAESPGDLVRALTRALSDRTAALVPEGETPSEAVRQIDGHPSEARTLVEALTWHVKRHPDRVHLRLYASEGEPVPITYGQLLGEARAVAGALIEREVAVGDAVALMLPTSRDFFVGFLGVLLAGASPVPIYPPSRPAQIEEHLSRQARILANARAKVLLTTPEAARLGQWLKAKVPSLRAVLPPFAAGERGPADLHAAVSAESVALLQYTSGSTGDPKGVVLSHRNLLANIRAMGEAARVSARDVFVSWLPLYHDMGLIGAWLGSLYYAFPLVVMSPVAFLTGPERWLWAMHQHRGTLSAAPNFAYEICASRIDDRVLEGLDLSSWRMAFNGAEPVSPGTITRFTRRFERYGFRPQVMSPVYGLAECAVGLAFPPPGRGPLLDRVAREVFLREGRALPAPDEEDPLTFVSSGRALPGHEIRIADGAGREAPDRVQGRIQFRGPSATSGYLRNERANQELFKDGWLDSGDLGYLAGSELFVTGRAKDVIIRAGRHVFPYELEEAVGAIPGVRRGAVCVFSYRGQADGLEKLVVAAETREHDSQRLRELRARIDAVTAALLGLAAEEVVLVPPRSVPKTSSGKLRRGACRDLYLRGELGRQRSVRLQLLRLWAQALPAEIRRVARRAGEVAWAGWFWLCFGALAVPAWLAAAVIPGQAARWGAVSAILRTFFALVGIPLRLEGQDRLPQGPKVLVANHPSYLDGLVLAAVLPQGYSFVAKRELADNPLLRVGLARLGIELVERHQPQRSAADSQHLEAVARSGRPLVFFPEGTTRRAPVLFPFHMGAFHTATAIGAPVVPVAIVGSRTVLRAGQWFPRRGAITVTVLPPLPTKKTGWSAALELRDRAREALSGATGDAPVEET
jgi:acyl carrier protein